MNPLTEVAPAFVAMAHQIVWCIVAAGAQDFAEDADFFLRASPPLR